MCRAFPVAPKLLPLCSGFTVRTFGVTGFGLVSHAIVLPPFYLFIIAAISGAAMRLLTECVTAYAMRSAIAGLVAMRFTT